MRGGLIHGVTPGGESFELFLPRWWGIHPSKNCPGGWSGLELTDTLFIYVLIKKIYI